MEDIFGLYPLKRSILSISFLVYASQVKDCYSKINLGLSLLKLPRVNLHSILIFHICLGIGDRHLSNYLVCQKTGRVVTIDFGYAFGISTSFLQIPELVQVRLTPQILAVMEPLGTHGLFRLAPFNLNFKLIVFKWFFDDSLRFPFKLLNTCPCSRDIFICLI